MKVTGKIIYVGETVFGEGRRGPWQKRPFEVQYDEGHGGQFAHSIAFDCFDAGIIEKLAVGQQVEVNFDITTFFYNERKFNDISVWRNNGIRFITETPAA